MGNGGGEGCGNRVEERGVAIGWGMVEERGVAIGWRRRVWQ